MGLVKAFCAVSLDGFIAAPGDDISWLEADRPEWAPMASGPWSHRPEDAVTFADFYAGVGAMLMGRRTFDVVHDMHQWFYGDTPVLVATGRPLPHTRPTVTSASAPIANLVAEAQELAGDKDVYLDGGTIIRQALDAGLVDQMIVTVHPTILGAGHPLFAGAEQRHAVTISDVRRFGDGMVQLTMTPAREPSDTSPLPADGGPADESAFGHA
ncbi:dihydrofolate reductase family protein [Demequina sp. B12]|uniref:dihydrofolate reductase family protein n=1 Tax=Demequina sp. B12 TaxID=2992757 RepID=UPI00237A84BD|nr:dihydrofolate reductase family protein [Demequina sp. B12]MDE0572873.1 dihydrofolate reductase family protein [Demequina sp. B12]